MLLSDDRSLAGGVATAALAAADCRYLVLQLQISDAAAATAGGGGGVGAAAAEGGSGPPVGTEAIGPGRWCCKIVRLVVTCGSWVIPRNPGGKKTETDLYVDYIQVQRKKTSARMP